MTRSTWRWGDERVGDEVLERGGEGAITGISGGFSSPSDMEDDDDGEIEECDDGDDAEPRDEDEEEDPWGPARIDGGNWSSSCSFSSTIEPGGASATMASRSAGDGIVAARTEVAMIGGGSCRGDRE